MAISRRASERLVAALQIANDIARRPLQINGLACFAELLRARARARAARALLASIAEAPEVPVSDRVQMRALLAKWPSPSGGPARAIASIRPSSRAASSSRATSATLR